MELSNIAIYGEWGIKLNYKALSYLSEPLEAFRSARAATLIIAGFSLLLFSFTAIIFAEKMQLFAFKKSKRNLLSSFLWLAFMPPLIFGSMRGSLQQIPISQSQSYHSKSDFINQASVNTMWNLMYSIKENRRYINQNPFTFYTLAKAKKEVENLYNIQSDSTVYILSKKNPNIVLIFLESWSGDFIDDLGSNLHITPGFSKLAKDGYLFTNHFASGMLSHQGISAVLSSFPSIPLTSITKQPEKYHKLPSLTQELKSKNYFTSFLFGGQLNYGNIKAYIYFNGFDRITEGKDFASNIPEGSLGHHDEFMLAKLTADINTYKQPFFASAFTLSSHSPFDQPVSNYTSKGGKYKKMLNSIYYSDSCIYDFIQKAKKMPWYKNTLFVFVADHSHPSPYEFPYYSKDVRKIPLLFYGDVIKKEYRGKTNNKIMSQTDIAATLLAQLHLPYDKFRWGKNIMNIHAPEFAYYGYDNGFGLINPKGNFAYLMGENQVIEYNFANKNDSIQLLKTGKSFVETLYQEYLDY